MTSTQTHLRIDVEQRYLELRHELLDMQELMTQIQHRQDNIKDKIIRMTVEIELLLAYNQQQEQEI